MNSVPRPLEQLGVALKLLRVDRAMRQGDLAEACGVTKTLISLYESGKASPQIATLEKLLVGLGADLGDLNQALKRAQTVSPKTSRVRGREKRPSLGPEPAATNRALDDFLTHMPARECRDGVAASTSPFKLLGKALLWLRKRHGVTQAKLAKSAGISAPHLSRIEGGQVQPKLPTLEKLLMTMGADLAALAVAYRAVEDPATGAFKAPPYLPLDEQEALLLSATGFQAFLTAASARLSGSGGFTGEAP